MQKNVAGQKLIVFAFDSTTNLPKTGDAANLTAYVSKDYGAVTVLGDTTATEMDSTNAKGYYLFDLTQAETNADTLLFSAKSTTANIVVVGVPATVFTTPPNFSLASIDGSGRVDVIKVNGTSQTARDLGAQLDVAVSTRMATYTQPTGFLAATFPGTVASPTNITAGTITTVTTLTNFPAIPANWLTAAGISAGALNGKGDWLLSSAYTAPLSAAGVRAAVGLASANLDMQISGIPAAVQSTLFLDSSLLAVNNLNTLANNYVAGALVGNWTGTVSGNAVPGSAMTLTAGERNSVADALLGRNVAGGSSSGRLVKEVMYAIRNKVTIVGTTMTVMQVDDVTPAWTSTLTTDAAALPITTSDPA